jgi:hypothetical protein
MLKRACYQLIVLISFDRDAFPSSHTQSVSQVFRQLRAEYFRLSATGLDDAQLLSKLRTAYTEFVAATDPSAAEAKWQCPKVRFGRTELEMPIITCGGMRQQQTWRPKEGMTMDDVNADCQVQR